MISRKISHDFKKILHMSCCFSKKTLIAFSGDESAGLTGTAGLYFGYLLQLDRRSIGRIRAASPSVSRPALSQLPVLPPSAWPSAGSSGFRY
jgi:hypothetical protein